MTYKLIKTENYLLVVDDSEIKDVRPYNGKWHLEDMMIINKFPTYLTDLSECKLIIAHLPINNAPILEGVPLLPPIEDDVEHMAQAYFEAKGHNLYNHYNTMPSFKEGYNKAKEKYKYTEDNLRRAIDMSKDIKYVTFSIDEIIQSLSQYPTYFECEMEYDCCKRYVNCIGCDATGDMINLRPKTITTAQGIQWVGKYK